MAVSGGMSEAFELHELGLAIQRQRLRRAHPDVDDAEIERLLHAWLADRPPDASGRLLEWDGQRGRAVR